MKYFIVSAFLLISQFLVANPDHKRQTREEYIEKYKEEAIREMNLHGIPASITLAQGMLESDNGNSPLAVYAKNHFGIKCNGWQGATFYQNDDTENECFRKYKDEYQSYKDHSEFLTGRSRYAFLFELKSNDYHGWAHGLKKAGYATNPKYPDLLIKIIEDNNLMEYDKMKGVTSKTHHKPEKTSKPHKPQVIAKAKQEISVKNNVNYILAKEGDTYLKIAVANEMGLWQIMKYNDAERGTDPKAGDIIYLQPKRRKSKEFEYHIAKTGQTLLQISQQYGVKLKKIKKYNNITNEEYVSPGQKIYLRKH